MARDDAFGRKLGELRPLILGWLLGAGVPDADVEDVAHDALVDLFGRAERLRALSLDELRAYAYLAAKHFAMNHIRARRRRAAREHAWLMSQPRSQHHHAAELVAAKTVVRAMPEPLAAVLVLCDVHGYSLSEAAAVLHAPLGTAKTRLRKARTHCRAALQGDESYQRTERRPV